MDSISFFIVRTEDTPPRIVNAEDESAAYEIVTGEPWPEDGPNEDESWECTYVTLKRGESLETSRF